MSETAEITERKTIWKSSGLHLTQKDENGWLLVTDDLLRAYYTRPEIHPVDESCSQEHILFERLMETPTIEVSEDDLQKIKDKDTVENYKIILAFRDHLLKFKTIEQAYLALFDEKHKLPIPNMFIIHMVHLIVSGLLEKEKNPFIVRASEVLFREQLVTNQNEQIMLADKEAVELYKETGGLGGLGSLLTEAGKQHQDITLDVLTENNKYSYWQRADQFNFALDFRYTEHGPDALANVLSKWVGHMLGVDVRVQAMQSIKDEQWSWHIGLDEYSSKILNDLYEGKSESEEPMNNFVGLFRLEFKNKTEIIEAMQGKAVYLGLAMSPENTINLKPQNLLMNLPIQTPN